MTGVPQSVATWVVNLERSTQRRAAMREELARAGIQATFLPAVDARDVPADHFNDRFDDFGPWGIVPRQNKAICTSHRNIWAAFLDTDADLALVFEDDVYIAPEMGDWLSDLSWWPEDADLVRFEVWDSSDMVHVVSRDAGQHRGRRIARLHTRHPGAAAYLITRAHAERLLSVERIRLTTDGFIFNPYVSDAARAARIYQVDPGMAVQGNDPGNEQTRRTAKKEVGRATIWRQEALRGWAELRNLPRHLVRLLTRRARLTRFTVSLTPVDPLQS